VFFQNRALAAWWRRLFRLRGFDPTEIDTFEDWLELVHGRPVCAVYGITDGGIVRIAYIQPD
jgi:hypothetical protein